jgi:hypothetical protein
MPNAFDALEPRPNGVLLYRLAQLGRGRLLVFDRAQVDVLEKFRSADCFSARDRLEQGVSVVGSRGQSGSGSPLKDGAKTLTVRDARALRLFEQLIQQSKLGSGAALVCRWMKFVERDRHADSP